MKLLKQVYIAEFKGLTVKYAKSRQNISAVTQGSRAE